MLADVQEIRREESISSLPIANDQRSKGSETIKGLLSITVGGILRNWQVGVSSSARSLTVSASRTKLLSMPDELLQSLVVALCKQQKLRLLDNISEVLYEGLSFW